MTSAAAADAKSLAKMPTPASSPPPVDMQRKKESDNISDKMQQEEERMRAQREKNDAKRDAQMEKERQEDLKSGKDILDKKFQQLEFLMNKSKASTPPVAN
jgi:ATP-dependent DNA helicase